MTGKLVAGVLILAATAFAHRLDEYLQGTLVSVETNRIEMQMTLTPGVAVFPFLMAYIDSDGNGLISEAEQRAYAGRVLQDLSITIDGQRLRPELRSLRFPTMAEMKEGRGEIRLDFGAVLPRGGGDRKLIIENHHQGRISAYQVNCLVPRDPNIRIVAQNRNYYQSFYELDFAQANPPFGTRPWLALIGFVLAARVALLWRQRTGLPRELVVSHAARQR
jgi:hypothetical protein